MNSNPTTGSYVVLVALLKEVSELSMDDNGEFFVTLNVLVRSPFPKSEQKEYTVLVIGDAAFRINRYGFRHARLLLEGELCFQEGLQFVCANKIAFLSESEDGVFDVGYVRSLVTKNLVSNSFYNPNIFSTSENVLH